MADDDFQQQDIVSRLKNKPMIALSSASWLAIVAYGLYKFKNRGEIPASFYLIKLRLVAQGAVVACLGSAIMYQMYKDYEKPPSSPQSIDK